MENITVDIKFKMEKEGDEYALRGYDIHGEGEKYDIAFVLSMLKAAVVITEKNWDDFNIQAALQGH